MKRRMKRLLAVVLSAAVCLPALSIEPIGAAESSGVIFTEEEQVFVNDYGNERTTKINDNWKFHLGSVAGASGKAFNDADWDYVDLPHDFSISQDFTSSGEAESGFLPGGTGWYRKHFMLEEEFAGKRFVLNFDGVYSHATVYVNGTKVGEHHYGYTPFAFDITDYLMCDSATDNIIAVEAVNNIPSSRWYSGSGIYRDVNLIVTDPVHVAHNGTFVTTPEIQNGSGKVNVSVEVQNDGAAPANVTVRNTVFEKKSNTSAASATESVAVPAGETRTVVSEPVVPSPKLWSPDSPNLYYVRTEILSGNTVLDTYDTEFGFKWYEFVGKEKDTDEEREGFFLNGEAVKINGVCMHHDQGALGSAAYYDAIYRQMSIMKDMGVNTIRITHNPGAEVLIDICNELGLLVIEEFFDGWAWAKNGNSYDFSTHFQKYLTDDNQIIGGDSSMKWSEFVLKATVKRDRNDASIILWSLGNEINEGSGGGPWNVIADDLIRWTEEVDETHPVTSGSNRRNLSSEGDTSVLIVNQKVYEAGGVPGYNYGYFDVSDSDYSKENNRGTPLTGLHERYPVMLWSETASAVTSRGIYMGQGSQANADGKYHLTSYDTSCVGWGKTAHLSMYPTLTADWVAGECVWTGFDYIGEPTPWNGTGAGDGGRGAVPNSSYFGIVETSGFPKDNYYLYRSQWNQMEGANTLNLVTAWDSANMMQRQGKTPVWIYSNAAKVELYRNNTLIGVATRKDLSETTTAMGHTHYEYTTESKDESICTTASGSREASLYSVFDVAFEEGTISAKAFDEDGNDITSTCEGKTSVSTPGEPAKLVISQDKEEVLADGSSLVYIAVDVTDEDGNLDTRAENDITFTLTGNGEILGVDNGDQATVDKFQQASVMYNEDGKNSKTRAHIKAYAGKALVIVRSTKRSGKITVNIASDGLTGGKADIVSKAPEGQSENGIESYRIRKHCYVPAGTASVALPAKISATRADGTEEQMNVTWKAIAASKLQKAGTFTVNGSIGSGIDQVVVSTVVHVYGNVVAAKNTSLYTAQNMMPSLPESLMTYADDGTEFEAFPVAWDTSGLSAADFSTIGEIVKIKGKVEASYIGKSFDVTASVRVAEAREAGVTNIAPEASELSQNCSPTSDDLRSIIDTVKYSDPNGSSGRWTDWNDNRSDKDTNPAAITFKWDTVHMLDEVRLYYYTDENMPNKPNNVKIELSSDGINFTEMGYTIAGTIPAVEDESTEGEIFKLNENTSPIAVRIVMERNGRAVGLTEVEIMSRQYTYDAYDSADLEGISVDGKAVSGVSAGKTDYLVDALGKITFEDGGKNIAVTILPEKEGIVTIHAVSEDGQKTKTYTIIQKVKEAEKSEVAKALQELKNVDSSKYTPDSYNKYMQAIAGLEKQMSAVVSVKDLNELKAQMAGLSAMLESNKTETLEKGQKVTKDGMEYKVLDPASKTLELITGNKKKSGKLTINTVDVNEQKWKVVSIGANAFKKANKLTSVTIGNNVTSIEKNAFANAAKLKTVVIGKKVKTIGAGAFNGCKKLSKVTFKGTAVTKIGKKAFKGTSKKITVRVPKKLKKNKKFKSKLTNAGMSKKMKLQ